MKATIAFLVSILFFMVPANIAGADEPDAKLMTPDMKWVDGPPSLPRGIQMALLEGDPGKPGPFTMRLKIPDGTKIAPHFHSSDEHITVLSGVFGLGMGDQLDRDNGKELTAGAFALMPKGHHHFAWTQGETVLQLHGIGPWDITYVNPADDPRRKI